MKFCRAVAYDNEQANRHLARLRVYHTMWTSETVVDHILILCSLHNAGIHGAAGNRDTGAL